MKLFEPVTGPETIGYTNGEEWEGRRKWVYDPLKGTPLESYMPTFVKVNCVLIVFSLHCMHLKWHAYTIKVGNYYLLTCNRM